MLSPRISRNGRGHLTCSHFFVIWVWRFPYIQMLARNFEELLRVEDMLHFLGTGHLHDAEAAGVAMLIPQNLR